MDESEDSLMAFAGHSQEQPLEVPVQGIALIEN